MPATGHESDTKVKAGDGFWLGVGAGKDQLNDTCILIADSLTPLRRQSVTRPGEIRCPRPPAPGPPPPAMTGQSERLRGHHANSCGVGSPGARGLGA